MSKNSKKRNRRLRRQEKRQKKLARRQKKWVMDNVYHNLVEKNMNYIINGLDTMDINKTYVPFRLSSSSISSTSSTSSYNSTTTV